MDHGEDHIPLSHLKIYLHHNFWKVDLQELVGGVSKEAYLDLYISPVVTALKLLFLILPLPTASMKVSSIYLCRG